MRKRFSALLLALCLTLGLMPVTAWAADPVSGDGWELAADGTLTISSDLAMSSWDSDDVNGRQVNASNVTSVVITDAVKSIGAQVFLNHINLTSITIPNSVETIEFGAFNGCTSLTSITIPNSVKTIEYGAFVNCTSLTSVTMRGNTPPTLDDSWGDDDVFKNCGFVQSNTKGIVVPSGSVQAYKDQWVQWKDYIAGDEPSAHSHPVCGAACAGHTESHGNVTWTEFPADSTTLADGSYYLTEDIGGITIPANTTVNLCLNEHKIENSAGHGISVNSGATLNLCDCAGGGAVTATGSSGSGISTSNGGTVNVYGGSVTATGSYGIFSSSGIVNVYGGSVTGSVTRIGSQGIYNSSGTVTVYGGTVTGGNSYGIYNYNNGTVNVYDGTVTGNGANGIGIYNSSGTVTMTGGTVTGGNGDGIYSKGTVTVTGGTVTGSNKYDIYGIYHNGTSFTLGGNPTITGGTANLYFANGKTVTVDNGGLTGGTYSVKTAATPTEAEPVAITTPASADYSGRFTSADASYAIRNSGTGDAQVVQLVKPHRACAKSTAWTTWGIMSNGQCLTAPISTSPNQGRPVR